MASKTVTTSKQATPARRLFETTHARHDRTHVLAGGLFRSLAKGQQDALKLRAWYGQGNSADDNLTGIEFVGPDPLGALELRVLQVLVAMAGKKPNPLPPQPKTPEGNSLRSIIDQNRDCQARPDDQHLAVRTSYRQIAIECGLDPESASGFKRVRKSMERMANVSIWQQTAVPGKKSAIRWKVGSLLEQVITQDKKSPVLVGINAMLSETILSSKQYTRIQLDEARALSDPGVLIHQRLCGSVDQGKKWTFSIETLAAYAWPDASLQPHSMRRRKQNVRKVLDELSALHWIVQETTPGNIAITRPK